jgi:poly(A) polymerase
VRSDCTTRNQHKAQALQESIDDLERRIAELAEEDRRNAERPQIDGDAVMSHLGIGPGREVGEIMRWLLELKRTEGELSDDELLARLDAYWAQRTPS